MAHSPTRHYPSHRAQGHPHWTMSPKMALALVSLLLLALLDSALSEKRVRHRSMKCKSNQFKCRKSRTCIDKTLTCDGNQDCPDGSDESADCSDACRINGTIVVDSTVTTQDEDWWYTCSRSRWRAAGCIINNRRYAIGQIFTRYQNDFWGKCEKLGSNYLRRHLYGCVDYQGRLIKPGETYLIDALFWAKCTSHTTTAQITGLGNITLNSVRREIMGCNDGTEQPVLDDQEFLEMGDDGTSDFGVAMKCKLVSNDWPQIVPFACVISNEIGDEEEEYVGLTDGCYEIFGPTVYYCSITGKVDVSRLESSRLNGTWKFNWQLSWNSTSDQAMKYVESKGFVHCPDTEEEERPEPAKKTKEKRGNKRKDDARLRNRRRAKDNSLFRSFSITGKRSLLTVRAAVSTVNMK